MVPDVRAEAGLQVSSIVTPDTLLRWYREPIARKYDGSARHGGPCPERKSRMVEILVRMAKENPTCGYTRLRDMLMNLGFKMSRRTVRRVLLDHGLEPAPRRSSWKTFIKSHWDWRRCLMTARLCVACTILCIGVLAEEGSVNESTSVKDTPIQKTHEPQKVNALGNATPQEIKKWVSEMGYGAKGSPLRIPANATLVFETELLEVSSKAASDPE